MLMLENAHEKQEDQSDEEDKPQAEPPTEPATKLAQHAVPVHEQENSNEEESASYLTKQFKQQELIPSDVVDRPQATEQLLPLTIVPPIHKTSS